MDNSKESHRNINKGVLKLDTWQKLQKFGLSSLVTWKPRNDSWLIFQYAKSPKRSKRVSLGVPISTKMRERGVNPKWMDGIEVKKTLKTAWSGKDFVSLKFVKISDLEKVWNGFSLEILENRFKERSD